MELSLISIISLLLVCSAVLIGKKVMTNTSLRVTIRRGVLGLGAAIFALAAATPSFAQSHQGGEASLELPDLSAVKFLNDAITGHNLLLIGIVISLLGLLIMQLGFISGMAIGMAVVVALTLLASLTLLPALLGFAGERIELAASANVVGDLSATQVVIVDGAQFNGRVNVEPRNATTIAPNKPDSQ